AGTGVITAGVALAVDARAVTLTGGLTILGNDGGDQIVGTNASDTITGGTGNDTSGAVGSGGGLQAVSPTGEGWINPGSGNDLIVIDVPNLSINDTINGGLGNDELRLVGGGALNMSGFPLTAIETLGLSDGSAAGYTLTVDGSLASFQNILSDATL